LKAIKKSESAFASADGFSFFIVIINRGTGYLI
jgi:hypothetical protein